MRALSNHHSISLNWCVIPLLLSMLGLLLLACTATPPALTRTASEFTLAPGDKIRVQVYEHPEFSGDFLLDATGTIAIPQAGAIALAGKTPRQAETAVGQKLSQELNNPQVAVNMIEYRPIYVLGQVSQPGEYPFKSGMKVLNAIALAHGYTYRADQSNITIIRGNDPSAAAMGAAETDELQPGDTVKVLERWF